MKKKKLKKGEGEYESPPWRFPFSKLVEMRKMKDGGMTYQEIGNTVNVTRQRVFQMIGNKDFTTIHLSIKNVNEMLRQKNEYIILSKYVMNMVLGNPEKIEKWEYVEDKGLLFKEFNHKEMYFPIYKGDVT